MAPLRTLRPVLFLVVFFFVALPLTVYHFFTFDFQRVASLERKFRAVLPGGGTNNEFSGPLPRCLDVPSAAFLRHNASQTLQDLCGNGDLTEKPNTQRQRLVHFVHVPLAAVPLWDHEEPSPREQFTYLQFAVVQSVRRALQPEMMMMHYLDTPRGVWYTQCQRHLSLHQVLPPVSFEEMKSAGPPYLNVYQRRQIMEFLIMLRTLKKLGGVAFSDFNTFLLRAHSLDIQSELVVASHARSTGGFNSSSTRRSSSQPFSIGLHSLQAPPGHPFVEYLEQRLVNMVLQNDRRLHEMPLEAIVGQLTFDKYLGEHGDESEENIHTGNASTAIRSSITRGVVIGTSNLFEYDGLHELLTVRVDAMSTAGSLRDVTGFHVDRYDFAVQTADTSDLREISRMQQEFSTADKWLNLDTLLGAVMRLVVTVNTSAELEPLLA
ncbi:hypothetical protein BBJ28_00020714 [Nothophytophthora sp. Chile5]|nr:hypothetical protein BBJ28_00020714 [Nothophytophthora sp. Chile5]